MFYVSTLFVCSGFNSTSNFSVPETRGSNSHKLPQCHCGREWLRVTELIKTSFVFPVRNKYVRVALVSIICKNLIGSWDSRKTTPTVTTLWCSLLWNASVREPVWPDIATPRHVGRSVQQAEWIWLMSHPAKHQASSPDQLSLAVIWVERPHLSIGSSCCSKRAYKVRKVLFLTLSLGIIQTITSLT